MTRAENGATTAYVLGVGNRLWSAANAVTNSYTANNLNQYTSILPPLGTRFARLGRFSRGRDHPQGAVTRLCGK